MRNIYQVQMNEKVRQFVERIALLARREAVSIVQTPRGRGGTGAGSAPPFRGRGRPPGTGSPKRTSEYLEKLGERFLSFVKANPGLRIEQINKELGTQTKDLALPIRKLIARGHISIKGQKRSTTYFPGNRIEELIHPLDRGSARHEQRVSDRHARIPGRGDDTEELRLEAGSCSGQAQATTAAEDPPNPASVLPGERPHSGPVLFRSHQIAAAGGDQ